VHNAWPVLKTQKDEKYEVCGKVTGQRPYFAGKSLIRHSRQVSFSFFPSREAAIIEAHAVVRNNFSMILELFQRLK